MLGKSNDVQRVLRWRATTAPTRLGQALLVAVLAFIATGDWRVGPWLLVVTLTILFDARLCQVRLAGDPESFGPLICAAVAVSASVYAPPVGLLLLRQPGMVGVAEAALISCAVMLNAAMMSRGVKPLSLILIAPPAVVLMLLPPLAILFGHPISLHDAIPLTVGALSYSVFVAKIASAFGAEGRAMQEALAEREAAMQAAEQARDAAQAANQAKSEFLATVSHEIRTPLNGVLGMAQAMARDELTPVQAERLDVVSKSGESLLAILNDILDLSKIEAGKLELEQLVFDLEDLARGVHATFAAVAEAKGVALSLAVADGARGAWCGDPVRVRQILHNLVSNAVKFTLSGEIEVSVEAVAGGARLTVRDTGIGIPEDRIALLFDKFVQADSSTTRRFGGTGLGLAICAELCRAMGGSIQAQSTVGAGSVFSAELPLAWLGAEAQESLATHPAQPDGGEARAQRVLAAEDNPVNQLVLKTIMGQLGLWPVVVDNGAAAVEAWEAADWDLILMDVQMPLVDGPAATRRIRALEAASGRPRTPIIALTANAMTHQLASYRAAGMDAVVSKPLNIEDLVRAINEAMAAQGDAAADDLSVAAAG